MKAERKRKTPDSPCPAPIWVTQAWMDRALVAEAKVKELESEIMSLRNAEQRKARR